MRLFLQLRGFFRQHWQTYLLAMAMLATVALLNTAVPWLIGTTIDQLIAAGELSAVTDRLWLLLAMALVIYGLRFGWRLVLFGTSYQLGSLLRKQFYQRLTRLGSAFYSLQGTGDLMARATNDIDAVEVAAGEGVLSGFDGLLTFVLVLIMMLSLIDWRLTLVALIPFPFMGWGFYRISVSVHQQFQQALARFSDLNDKTQEALSGIRLVKAMGREDAEAQQFNQLARQAADTSFQVARSEALYEPLIYLALTGAMLLTLGFGGYLYWHNELTVGQLTSFTIYMGQLIWPMWAFGWLLNIIERGSAAMVRVEALLKTPDSISDQGQQPVSGAHLSCQQLNFSYPPSGPEILQGIDLQLAPGKTLAIVGPTGAGKTTLLQLLMRQWECKPGTITLDDTPLAQLSLDSLRRQFAYVPQDNFLFSLSIADNIALSRPDASQAEIEQVARLAALHDDIVGFPASYQTAVGERGVTLSGGQRQRLTIARALLSQAPILVLDDALSAVDVQTEQQILQALNQAQTNPPRSCLIVSHRLSAVQQADEIIVLSHGKVAERGSHSQLLARDGWYSRMWTYQQLEASLDDH